MRALHSTRSASGSTRAGSPDTGRHRTGRSRSSSFGRSGSFPTGTPMPEGDALHRTAERLRVLEGEVLEAESPHPRAALLGIAKRIDGKRLERVEACGKNLLLTFEGGLVVRSHLRMHGRWLVQPAGKPVFGRPWLVLRAREWQAVQRNGPVLELGTSRLARLGPDIMIDPPAEDRLAGRLHEPAP